MLLKLPLRDPSPPLPVPKGCCCCCPYPLPPPSGRLSALRILKSLSRLSAEPAVATEAENRAALLATPPTVCVAKDWVPCCRPRVSSEIFPVVAARIRPAKGAVNASDVPRATPLASPAGSPKAARDPKAEKSCRRADLWDVCVYTHEDVRKRSDQWSEMKKKEEEIEYLVTSNSACTLSSMHKISTSEILGVLQELLYHAFTGRSGPWRGPGGQRYGSAESTPRPTHPTSSELLRIVPAHPRASAQPRGPRTCFRYSNFTI